MFRATTYYILLLNFCKCFCTTEFKRYRVFILKKEGECQSIRAHRELRIMFAAWKLCVLHKFFLRKIEEIQPKCCIIHYYCVILHHK